jgi:hypothetical protein
MVNIANKLLIIILSKNQELPIVMITSITLMILLFTATRPLNLPHLFFLLWMYYPFFLSELYIDSGWEQIPVLKATDQKYCVHVLYYWCSFMLVVINSEFVTFYVEIQISYQDSTVPYRKWNNGMKKLKCCHMSFYIHYGPVFIKVLSCAYVYSLCSCVYQSVVMCLCIFIMFLCSSKWCHVPMYIHYVPVTINL